MLTGRNDVSFLAHWFPRYPQFVGASSQQHGAYGQRLRRHFGFDQLEQAYKALRGNPDTRQVVLQIWDPASDFPDEDGQARASDIPCNVISTLKVRRGRLDWLQLVRSNDVDRGLPYNLIQFTVLHELMAAWIGADLGTYVHVIDSAHWYMDHSDRMMIDNHVVPEESSDRINTSWDDTMSCFEILAERMDNIRQARHEHRKPELHDDRHLPQVYENIFAVIAADDARRHGEMESAQQLLGQCDNPALIQVWARWCDAVTPSALRLEVA